MTFTEFLDKRYRPLAGSAVPLKSVIRNFYRFHKFDNSIPFTFPPHAIRRYLETRFPIGTFAGRTMVGNLHGADGYGACDRELVHFLGMLCPRDLRPDEFAQYRKTAESDNRVSGRKIKQEETLSAAGGAYPASVPRLG